MALITFWNYFPFLCVTGTTCFTSLGWKLNHSASFSSQNWLWFPRARFPGSLHPSWGCGYVLFPSSCPITSGVYSPRRGQSGPQTPWQQWAGPSDEFRSSHPYFKWLCSLLRTDPVHCPWSTFVGRAHTLGLTMWWRGVRCGSGAQLRMGIPAQWPWGSWLYTRLCSRRCPSVVHWKLGSGAIPEDSSLLQGRQLTLQSPPWDPAAHPPSLWSCFPSQPTPQNHVLMTPRVSGSVAAGGDPRPAPSWWAGSAPLTVSLPADHWSHRIVQAVQPAPTVMVSFPFVPERPGPCLSRPLPCLPGGLGEAASVGRTQARAFHPLALKQGCRSPPATKKDHSSEAFQHKDNLLLKNWELS